MSIPPLRVHVGRNIQKIRELRNIKQAALAKELNVSQATMSTIEGSEDVDDERLGPIAKALGVTPEGIRSFNSDSLISSIGNNNHDNNEGSVNINAAAYYELSPIDRVTELYEKMLGMERERLAEAQEQIRALKERVKELEQQAGNR